MQTVIDPATPEQLQAVGDTAERELALPAAIRKAGSWQRGAPPWMGWWLAGTERSPHMWRWWNGYYWSISAPDTCTAEEAAASARYCAPFQHLIEWHPYRPLLTATMS